MFHFHPKNSENWTRCDQAATFESRCTRVLRIEALLVITASMFVFLGVFGLFRRRCSNRTLALIAFGAYALSPAIIAYTLGLIQSAPFCSSHFPVWAAYLVVALGSADSYTAHNFEDIEQWKSFNVDSAAKCFMTSYLIASYVTDLVPILCAVFLFVILFVKVDERARALMWASNSMMEKNSELIADYMRTEYGNPSDGDPAKMHGYRYLVRLPDEAKLHSLCLPVKSKSKESLWLEGHAPDYLQKIERMDGVITMEKVWSCKGTLLSGSGVREGRLKDLCLSFSLFKFICMRFTGHSLPQEAHNELWHLIQQMLGEDKGPERVFRVIEVELAFLFDLLYTKYPVNLNLCGSLRRLLLLTTVVAAPVISDYFGKTEPCDLVVYNKLRFSCNDLADYVTLLLMMSILVIGIAHFCIMIFSEWAKVMYICKYVQNEWWKKKRCAGKLIEIMCRVWLLKPWGRQLRQYSLLEAYGYSPWKCIYNRFTAPYLDPKGDGQKQLAPTNLPKQVIEAIARSIGRHGTSNLENGQASIGRDGTSNLEKGIASLKLNDVFVQLSWACNHETAAHVIMVWHIATTFCEHEKPLSGHQLSPEQRDNFGIATKLSKYLAYLVAFAPRLLPGHPCRTEYIFSRAVSEARELLKGSSVSMGDRIQKLKSVPDDKQTIVGQGARLGRQLVNKVANEERIWKVLADFWAEMMLYVAPSNNTPAHAKYLTTGGEFVTHVWVLVTHVGFRRVPHSSEQHGDPESN